MDGLDGLDGLDPTQKASPIRASSDANKKSGYWVLIEFRFSQAMVGMV